MMTTICEQTNLKFIIIIIITDICVNMWAVLLLCYLLFVIFAVSNAEKKKRKKHEGDVGLAIIILEYLIIN
jgi:hypothetical protein